MRFIVLSVFLYVWETWTLNANLQRRILALKMRCYRKILGIHYTDHVINEEILNTVQTAIDHNLLTVIRKPKMSLYGHVLSTGLAK